MDESAQSNYRPRVYSYIRFSTPDQAKGRSEGRQNQLAQAYARKRGYVFDEKLNMADRGLSGFKGDNLKFGAMGAFLKRIQNGSVKRGDVLVVENIDRITRMEPLEALDVIGNILRAGIEIHTTSPEMTYDSKAAEQGTIYLLIGQITLAHSESAKKASRLGDAWSKLKQAAREEKRVITKRCPQWLFLKDGCFVENRRAVAAIRSIFEDSLTLGPSRLIKKLNTGSSWKPSERGWRMSYVQKILRNRAVLGEYQPYSKRGNGRRVPDGEPIPNYFPRIIQDEQFHAVQKKIEANRGTGGPTNTARSIFQGLCVCAYCGGPMHRSSKGPKPKGGVYLVCDNAARGVKGLNRKAKCTGNSVRYEDLQETVLNNCQRLRPELVLPAQTESRKLSQRLRIEISGREQEIGNLENKIAATVDILMVAKKGLRDDLIQRQEKMRIELGRLKTERDAVAKELVISERNQASFTEWQRDLATLTAAILPEGAVELRLQLRSHLRDFISSIEVFGRGFARAATGERIERRPLAMPRNATPEQRSEWRRKNQALRPTVDEIVEELEEYIEAASDPSDTRPTRTKQFLEEVLRRRMSVEGRFYRITFTTGSFVDIVPEGSLASGLRLLKAAEEKKEAKGAIARHVVGPNIGLLWDQYMKKQASVSSRQVAKKAKAAEPCLT